MKVRITQHKSIGGNIYYKGEYKNFWWGWLPLCGKYGEVIKGYDIKDVEKSIKESKKGNVVKEWTI
ncbi:hypothetical protein AXI71_gp04 [Lactococcus phage GE1]|uniref:Uncharacterized protein n=1 Tax=Lactococcus phage GE1 TaxID=1698369 RepID=A0A0N9BAT3_9CAUD|nr:hypothetical protein AXI71_gp04 [Lactococcus phage GE1]ALA06958.1 hypothetical protein [Lactococcus phage GE1]